VGLLDSGENRATDALPSQERAEDALTAAAGAAARGAATGLAVGLLVPAASVAGIVVVAYYLNKTGFFRDVARIAAATAKMLA